MRRASRRLRATGRRNRISRWRPRAGRSSRRARACDLQVLPRIPAHRGGARRAPEDQRGEAPRTNVQSSEVTSLGKAPTVAIRSRLGLVCAFILARCASATAIRVERSDVVGPCLTAVPDRDVLLGVALSGGGSRAALFGAAGLEALAGLRTADG